MQGDIGDRALVDRLLAEHQPRAVVNFAAESHVDRSIHGPGDFMRTNVLGTFRCWRPCARTGARCDGASKAGLPLPACVAPTRSTARWRPTRRPSPRQHPYEPNSPYSASKAASDHLVRAWHHTYGLPVLTTNCSNNYGPYHFPEKLIPLMIVNALAGKPLPVYGDGMQVRDWLYVGDHCSAHPRACWRRAASARPTTSAAGTRSPTSRSCTPSARCSTSCGPTPTGPHERLITYVKDRPGHDRRYAIDARKIERELGWRPAETFDTGIRKTVQWYLDHARLGGARAERRLPRLGRAATTAAARPR